MSRFVASVCSKSQNLAVLGQIKKLYNIFAPPSNCIRIFLRVLMCECVTKTNHRLPENRR